MRASTEEVALTRIAPQNDQPRLRMRRPLRLVGTKQIALQTHARCIRETRWLSGGGTSADNRDLKGRQRQFAIGRQLADRFQ